MLDPSSLGALDDDDDDDDELVALRVALPHHPAASFETLWAERLVEDHYVLRSIPQYAYGLGWGDVVHAPVPATPGAEPLVAAVVRRSGHRTLRVTFLRRTLPRQRVPLLDALRELGVSYEGSPNGPVAVDVRPTSDYRAILARLGQWKAEGRLYFETCERRTEDGFDAAPAEDFAAAMQAMTLAASGRPAGQPRRSR